MRTCVSFRPPSARGICPARAILALVGALWTASGASALASEPVLVPVLVREGLALQFTVPFSGVVTLLESAGEWSEPASWMPVRSAPAVEGIHGSFLVRDQPTASGRFYRLELRSISIPSGLRWVAPGTFVMGSSPDEPGASDLDCPPRVVELEQGYWMAACEVTQAEFSAVTGKNPSNHQGDSQCPVESITWEEATNYCAQLTTIEGRAGRVPPGYVYRLPTEAEWEYACRAGTTAAYSFGDDATRLTAFAWWGYGDAGGASHPVGLKTPNPWGFYDLHGNVFELCLDLVTAYPGAQPYTGVPRRVARGGSYYCPANILRSAGRTHGLEFGERSHLHGFRVVLGPRGPLDALAPMASRGTGS